MRGDGQKEDRDEDAMMTHEDLRLTSDNVLNASRYAPSSALTRVRSATSAGSSSSSSPNSAGLYSVLTRRFCTCCALWFTRRCMIALGIRSCMLSRTIEKYDAMSDRIRLISISSRVVICVPLAETYTCNEPATRSSMVAENGEEEDVLPRCACPSFSCRTPRCSHHGFLPIAPTAARHPPHPTYPAQRPAHPCRPHWPLAEPQKPQQAQ